MKYPAVIQIRNGSSRLPGKAMQKVMGRPILYYLIERVKAVSKIGQVITATTTEKSDDELVNYCRELNINTFRGENKNVLKRICDSIKLSDSEYIIKFWGDSPLIDPMIVEDIIQKFESNYMGFDYVSNNHPSTYPEGMQIEIIKSKVLHKINKLNLSGSDREHVTGYIWRNTEIFKVGNIEYPENIHDSYRIVLDYREDFEQIKRIVKNLYPEKKLFTMEDVIIYLDSNPDVKKLNIMHYETEADYNSRVFLKN